MWKKGGKEKREKQSRKRKEGRKSIEFIFYYNSILRSFNMFAYFLHIIDLQNNHFHIHFIDEETEGHTL